MSIFGSLRQMDRDIRMFGVRAALRNIGRLASKRPFALDVPGFGSILVRRGDSDYETVVQALGDREYAIGRESVQARMFKRYGDILQSGHTPVVVDAGANIGAAALWFRSLHPEAAIVAVEPYLDNIAILKQCPPLLLDQGHGGRGRVKARM